ncbi:hypothetical protein [Novosphingobium sp. 9]|uniref:hypothetical protein n=1 Tax=Novosphingobium sp. 9 TaxID=2025349 RepID=UPI0021B5E94D|nr:hypothetical protein [Novosphingobium sp. 9]
MMTFVAYRFVLFLAIGIVPVVSRLPIGGETQARRAPSWLAPGALGLVVIATLAFQPTRFAPELPLAAAHRLKDAHVRGTVYADFPYGGILIDTGWPDWRVAYDGRYYRYSSDEWQLNGGVEAGYVPLVDVTRHWRPAAFLLNDEHNRSLAGELAHSRRWCRIFEQSHIVVYVPAWNTLCAPKRPRR